MMSTATLSRLNNDVCAKAASKGLKPYVPFDQAEIDAFPPFPFPNLGGFEPEGWEEVGRYFLDKTGTDDSGPAMSLDHFKSMLTPGVGYAIVEEGEYQVYIGEFARKGKNDGLPRVEENGEAGSR